MLASWQAPVMIDMRSGVDRNQVRPGPRRFGVRHVLARNDDAELRTATNLRQHPRSTRAIRHKRKLSEASTWGPYGASLSTWDAHVL